MKQSLILIILILPLGLFAQADIDFYCGEQRHSYSLPTWYVPVQKCNSHKLYSKSVNFKKIPSNDRMVIDSIYEELKTRGGKKFFRKLDFETISISQNDQDCNGFKYSFRISYRLNRNFFQRFTLTFDKNGQLLTTNKFPNILSNPNAHNIISICSAIDIAMENREFYEALENSEFSTSISNRRTGEQETLLNISRINLEYFPNENIWTWVLHSETRQVKGKGWIGSVITINAETGKVLKVDDFKEYKIIN